MHALRATRWVGGRARPAPVQTESSARLDPLIGTVVSGRYRIQELIASGGMGRVYRATQEPLGRSVALKVVRHEDETDDNEALLSQRRLELEATLLGQLQHPNIVTLYDFGEIDGAFKGRSFLAMELLQGRTLQACLDVDRRLAPARVVAIAEQMVRGLCFAHQRGIVHRDLKPSNVILIRAEDGSETVKLVDFGIGKMLSREGASHELTRAGAVIGTVGYMAPEQLHARATPASDLFALGVVLFEALTGRLPFERPATPQTDGFAEPAPRLRDVTPDLALPGGLESLVASLLALIPDERPSASDVLRLLEGCHDSAEPAPPAIVASPVVAQGIVAPASRTDLLVRVGLFAIVAYALVLIAMFSRG